MDSYDTERHTLIATNSKRRQVGAFFLRPWASAVMCHFVRTTDDGVEFRSRFWLGRQLVDGQPRTRLPPFVKVPAAAARGLARHNVLEYANLASFLPALYREMNA
jgi:hypothetical protein